MGASLAQRRVPFRGLVLSLLNTGMGLPPVVVGLFFYLLLSRSGPLGFFGLLYTPTAMIIVQAVLAFPIVASLSHAAVAKVDPVIRQAAITLGATPFQEVLTVIKEARYGIMAGVMAGLGRVMAEVGAILIVGGNIAGYTRVITTTIVLQTSMGDFELAIALGIILLLIALGINVGLRFFQRHGRVRVGSHPMGLSLEVVGISKSYNGQAVLRECSFSFDPGRTYALLGPNGSGKSTFLRIAALLEPPDAGQVRYLDQGVVLPHDLALRRRITLLLPKIGVFNTSVFQNVAYGLKIRGRALRKSRTGSTRCWSAWVCPTSGGRMAWTSPAVRPSAWGSPGPWSSSPRSFGWMSPPPISTQKIPKLLNKSSLDMKTAGKSTIIVVTHDPAQARRLGDHLLVMDNGRIVPL